MWRISCLQPWILLREGWCCLPAGTGTGRYRRFYKKAPHDLVEAFKSTLEEVKYADLILHVIDCLAGYGREGKVVERVLTDLGAVNSPKINVYNKIDLVDVVPTVNGRGVYISAKDKTGLTC